MSEIEIKCASENDIEAISDFICAYFNGTEPIQMFYHDKSSPMDPPPKDMIKESIDSQFLFLAFTKNQLVGVLIAGEITKDIADKDIEYAETSNYGQMGMDVFNLLSYVGEKADICNRLKVQRSLHIHIVSVHPNFLRMGIARKLFKECIEQAERREFPACSVDCTSFYTSKIAESFNMICESYVTYHEYNNHIGKILFNSSEPHTVIKTYAKIFSIKNF